MYEFDIPDMSCGHCVGTVTQAIKSVDRGPSPTSTSANARPPWRPGPIPARSARRSKKWAIRRPTRPPDFRFEAGRERPAHLYPRRAAEPPT